MRRIIAFSLAFTMLFCITASRFGAAAYDLPQPPMLTSKNIVLQNLETSAVVYEKNSTERIFPASTVKIMTAIVAMEHITDLDEQVTASAEAVANVSGNNIGIVEGETFAVRDLLYALIIGGANDAAYILAEYVSGTIPDFVQQMNYKAEEIGCMNTYYTNPTGLHNDNQYTTAADTARICMYAYNTNMFLEISSTTKYTIAKTNLNEGNRAIFNRNHFVSQAAESRYFYRYARGMNAGSTLEAGYSLCTVAEQKGLSYLAIIMGGNSETIDDIITINTFQDAKYLFNWIFDSYQFQKVLDKKDIIEEVSVDLAVKNNFVLLAPETHIEALIPVGIDRKTDLTRSYTITSERIVAPIKKGQVLGEITISFEGKILGQTNLVSQASVERSNILYFLDLVKQTMSERWFKASAVALGIFVVFYALISAVGYARKRRRKF